MPLYLNTLGEPTVGIGICDRCKMKRPLARLVPDGNSPGLRVCEDKSGCRDKFDPWRLPARRTENIALRYPRPDEDLVPLPPISILDRICAAFDFMIFADQAESSVVVLFGTAEDAVSFSDSALSTSTRAAEGSDLLSLSDSAVSSTGRFAAASDTLAVSDAAEGGRGRAAVATDTLTTPTDSAVATSAVVAAGADTISFSDSASGSSGDPYYANTVLILRGQGTPGASVVTDSSPLVWVPDSVTGVTTENSQALPGFGTTSLEFVTPANVEYSSVAAKTLLGQAVAAGSNIWTMEAWVRQASAVTMSIFSYRPPTTIGWAFTSTGLRANLGGVWSDTWIDVPPPDAAVWTHVALVRNGNDFYYWTGGALAQYLSNSGNITVNSSEFLVGAGPSGEQPFQGNMYARFTPGIARYLAPFTPPDNFPSSS